MLKLAGFSFSATMEFAKPPLSYADQAALLIARGLVVSDPNVLMRQLEAVGYYRLCAYWHPFKQVDSSFVPGTSFDVVWNRYVFDRQLRLAAMDAIERVEIAIRTALVTELAMRHGAFAHVDPKNFPSAHPARHARFLEELRSEAQRSRERFVDHFKATYDEFPDLPIWAAVETMTFGSMFTLFAMSEKKVLAVGGQHVVDFLEKGSMVLVADVFETPDGHHTIEGSRHVAIVLDAELNWQLGAPLAPERGLLC